MLERFLKLQNCSSFHFIVCVYIYVYLLVQYDIIHTTSMYITFITTTTKDYDYFSYPNTEKKYLKNWICKMNVHTNFCSEHICCFKSSALEV